MSAPLRVVRQTLAETPVVIDDVLDGLAEVEKMEADAKACRQRLNEMACKWSRQNGRIVPLRPEQIRALHLSRSR